MNNKIISSKKAPNPQAEVLDNFMLQMSKGIISGFKVVDGDVSITCESSDKSTHITIPELNIDLFVSKEHKLLPKEINQLASTLQNLRRYHLNVLSHQQKKTQKVIAQSVDSDYVTFFLSKLQRFMYRAVANTVLKLVKNIKVENTSDDAYNTAFEFHVLGIATKNIINILNKNNQLRDKTELISLLNDIKSLANRIKIFANNEAKANDEFIANMM